MKAIKLILRHPAEENGREHGIIVVGFPVLNEQGEMQPLL
jgi:hypothetical protein